MRDVAAQAGVSVRTVSRLLSGKPVSAYSQLRIEAAIRVLEYVPSAAARALQGQAPRLMGVLVEGATPEEPGAGLLRGVQEVASEQGLQLLVSETDGSSNHLEHTLEVLISQRVEAIVRLSAVHQEVVPGPQYSSVSLVLANAEVSSSRQVTVLADPEGAAHSGTEALLSLGHKRVGLLLPSVASRTTVGCERGYRTALLDARAALGPVVSVRGVSATEGGRPVAASALGGLFSDPAPPTALVCVGEDAALGALTELMAGGIGVPSQVSLLCIAREAEVGAGLHPSLAVVALGHREVGRRAALLALSGDGVGVERVASRVILRRSVRSRRL